MKKIFMGAGALVLLLVLAHAGRLLKDAGAFRHLENKGFGDCHSRGAIVGAEDMEWSPRLGKIFVSSDQRPEHGEPTPSGAIYVFSPANQAVPVVASGPVPFPFHPHGMGLWDGEGETRLFVVNHRPEGDSIEIFAWKVDHLEHVRSLKDPLVVAGNDILATGPNEFYLTSDHGTDPGPRQEVEHFLRHPSGYLSRFNGETFRKVAGPLFFANGLAWDPQHRLLFLAEMLEKRVLVYDMLDPAAPVFRRSIDLDSAPDNIKLDAGGTLWAGAHPQLLKLKNHSRHHEAVSPTVIVKVPGAAGPNPRAQEVMVDDGHLLSASSVALPLPGRLFLGSIYDRKILECPAP